jgi:hypothetical protein
LRSTDIAGTVHHANDLDTLGDLAIQDEIPPHRKVAEALRNVGTRRTKVGLICEEKELLFDVIEEAVGGPDIVVRDVELEGTRLDRQRAWGMVKRRALKAGPSRPSRTSAVQLVQSV